MCLQWVIKIRTTTCFSLINFGTLNNLRSGKWSTASLILLQICPAWGEKKQLTKTNVPFAGMWFQDVTLRRVPVHIWAPPDFQHHSSLSGKIYSRKMCVWHDGLWNKFLIRWAFVICGLGAPRLRWSLVFQVVFLAVPRCCTTHYFSRDFCRTVIYQRDLFGRWNSRCFQCLPQQECKCMCFHHAACCHRRF